MNRLLLTTTASLCVLPAFAWAQDTLPAFITQLRGGAARPAFVAVGAAAILTTGRALDALTLGEAGARGLGVDLGRVQWVLGLGVGLATGAGVAVSGVIGFSGLVVPHLLRPLVGARPSALLIPSALGGGVVALAGDILVRLTPAAAEVKFGVAMAILGGPFFLATIVSMRRKLA